MPVVSESQIKALIRLLADENVRIAKTICARLVEAGDPAIPLLQEAEIEQPEMAARIAAVLEEIRGMRLEQEFHELLEKGDCQVDLERGVFLIARYAYPTLDERHYSTMLDDMASEVRDRLGSRVSGEEAVKSLGRFLFTEQGFHGNTKHYYDTENSYINKVLDRRTGIPISLSIVYLLLTHRLNLPAFGVGMPGHFLVKFEAGKYKIFVDCFNGGALLAERDCTRFLQQAGYGFEDRFLDRTSNRAILVRSLKNLIPIYRKMEEPSKEERLSRFITILEGGDDLSVPSS